MCQGPPMGEVSGEVMGGSLARPPRHAVIPYLLLATSLYPTCRSTQRGIGRVQIILSIWHEGLESRRNEGIESRPVRRRGLGSRRADHGPGDGTASRPLFDWSASGSVSAGSTPAYGLPSPFPAHSRHRPWACPLSCSPRHLGPLLALVLLVRALTILRRHFRLCCSSVSMAAPPRSDDSSKISPRRGTWRAKSGRARPCAAPVPTRATCREGNPTRRATWSARLRRVRLLRLPTGPTNERALDQRCRGERKSARLAWAVSGGRSYPHSAPDWCALSSWLCVIQIEGHAVAVTRRETSEDNKGPSKNVFWT